MTTYCTGKDIMKIRNVIFDIGKVLIDFEFERSVLDNFGTEKGEKVIAATWHDPDWGELDRGILSDEEVLQLFIANAPDCEREIRYTFARLGECPKMRKGAIELIDRLKADGYGVYYLSNYFEYLIHTAPWALEFIPHMDGGIFSCRVKVTKPDPAIYRMLCDRYGLVPEECVFIDDTLRNVDGARSFGMEGIHLTTQTYDELYTQIRAI